MPRLKEKEEDCQTPPRRRAPDLVIQEADPKLCGLPLKWISLVALTLQTSGQALLIRWARSSKGPVPYLASTVVFCAEVLKTFVSFWLLAVELGSVRQAATAVRTHLAQDPADLLKAAVPSLIYTVQNNLMFYSLERLSAPVQQVLYQMKILTTAALSVVFLKKHLQPFQWLALCLLAFGIALVQWPRQSALPAPTQATPMPQLIETFGMLQRLKAMDVEQLKGFAAVVCSCLTSSSAAVYVQMMLQQTSVSIWIRNVQLGAVGAVVSLMVALGRDGSRIAEDGFLQGYTSRVVLVIHMNALGGLLCAVMLKYAGATLGCFSTALSIILTSFLSFQLLNDFVPDGLFVFGALLAMSAVLLFSLGAALRLPGLGSTSSKCDTPKNAGEKHLPHLRLPTVPSLSAVAGSPRDYSSEMTNRIGASV